MNKSQRIALQAYADLTDNELARAIETACDRIEVSIRRDVDRQLHRKRKLRSAAQCRIRGERA